jgi:5'-nucleotidase
MEATLIGIPAIALSQVREVTKPVKWQTAEDHAAKVIRRLTRFAWARGVLMNVNFPNVPSDAVTGVQLAKQGRRIASIEIVPVTDPGGRPYLWVGDFTSDEALEKGTDLAAVEAGAIAVTPLHIDLTHQGMMRRMKQDFA